MTTFLKYLVAVFAAGLLIGAAVKGREIAVLCLSLLVAAMTGKVFEAKWIDTEK